jgi:hypothetical protein
MMMQEQGGEKEDFLLMKYKTNQKNIRNRKTAKCG